MIGNLSFAIALTGALIVDYAPLKTAAEAYGICAATATVPMLHSTKSTETVANLAIRSCSAEEQHMRTAVEKVFAPLGNASDPEFQATVERTFVKEKALLRTNLIAFVAKHRR